MLMDNDSAVELEMRDAKVLDLLMDAEKCRQQRDYGGEARMLSFALKLKPDDTMIWNKLGRAYRAAGFLDKAVSCYEKVLLLDRDDIWAACIWCRKTIPRPVSFMLRLCGCWRLPIS